MKRLKLTHALLLSTLLVSGSVLFADIYSPTVSLSITPPTGKAQTLDVRESEVGHLKLDNGQEYEFRPTINDAKPWNSVTVTIFKSATATAPTQSLGTVDLKTGAPAVASKTTPVFKIAVTKVTAPTAGPGK